MLTRRTLPTLLSLFLCLFLSLLSARDAAAQCVRNSRWSLSDVATDVLTSIENNPTAQNYSPVPLSHILSTCNRFESVTIDGPNIFAAAKEMISRANREVNMAFYMWDHDSVATRLIGEGLIAAQWRRSSWDPLLVRIVIDDVENRLSHTRAIHHIYDSQKRWEGMGLDLSRVHLQLATSPRYNWAQAAMHDKLITVDARWALVSGAQPERNSNPAGTADPSGWHDTGYIVEGDAAQSAVDAFEHTWNGDAIHWDCYPQSFSRDCDQRSSHFPEPSRWWVPAFGSQQYGDIPILAVGRTKGSVFDNDTNNPQAIAFLRLIDRATSHVNIETPNINDDAFQDAVKRAVARGVTVRLLTSLGFNDSGEDLPGLGGDNMEVVGRLRQAIRANSPWYQDRFQLRWYSQNGVDPVTGNSNYASHTKYMTMDDRVAVVGSGNQDTVSWNVSHEFNYLLDDAPVTRQLENSVFLPDWNRSTTAYLELYEGNNGTQDQICPIAATRNKSLRFSDLWFGGDFPCNNDEARSVLLHDIPAGKVFRFYDEGNYGYQDDDWTEIVVKRNVSRKYVDTFEQSFEDDDVRVIFHRDNGLDGKISSAEVASAPAGAVMDLYEGNWGSQNLVCSNRITGTRTIVLTSDAYCGNDEARSVKLYDFPQDKVIFVYDESGGSRGDDWALIVPKRHIKEATIDSFQSSHETADYRICYFSNNGLDGKVSRVRIGSRSEAVGYCGVTADSSCPEGTCVPAQGMYVSHFSQPGCGGTESYYLPYDGYAYQCRTWDGTGQCGTIRRTVTNYSARINGGPCQDLWQYGNTLSDFVTVYRGAPVTHTLAVGLSGTGSGSVTSSPAGINCPSATCAANYSSGTMVTLYASPDWGSSFAGWSGACWGTGSCTVSMSAAQTVYATFNAVTSGCPEGTCVPVQGMYVSHFSEPGCGGIESYYLPYDGYAYQCRTWDGSGQCGTIQHTRTNYSARINGGDCYDYWPEGNTLSEFVTIYR